MMRVRRAAEAVHPRNSRTIGPTRADLPPRRKSRPDVAAAQIAQATDALIDGTPTPHQRTFVQARKVAGASRVYAIATQPNPELALADMVVTLSLERAAWSGRLAEEFGARGAVLMRTYDEMCARLRTLAARVFSEEKVEALERAVMRWLEDQPDRRNAPIVRFDALSKYRPESLAEVGAPGGPKLLARVDEALRTTESLRLLGERAMFVLERMPTLVNWQVELLYSRILEEPESQRLLRDADGLTRAADRATRIASRTLGFAAVAALAFAGYRAIAGRGVRRRARRGW